MTDHSTQPAEEDKLASWGEHVAGQPILPSTHPASRKAPVKTFIVQVAGFGYASVINKTIPDGHHSLAAGDLRSGGAPFSRSSPATPFSSPRARSGASAHPARSSSSRCSSPPRPHWQLSKRCVSGGGLRSGAVWNRMRMQRAAVLIKFT